MRRFSLILTALVTSSLASAVHAEVRIEGDLAAMRITTDHERVSEVLAALAASPLAVRSRSGIPLNDAASRIYSGSFRHVISRLLGGYNYVIRTDRNAIEIFIIGRPADMMAPPANPYAGGGNGYARWRPERLRQPD